LQLAAAFFKIFLGKTDKIWATLGKIEAKYGQKSLNLDKFD